VGTKSLTTLGKMGVLRAFTICRISSRRLEINIVSSLFN
jgi:hypothetical protein